MTGRPSGGSPPVWPSEVEGERRRDAQGREGRSSTLLAGLAERGLLASQTTLPVCPSDVEGEQRQASRAIAGRSSTPLGQSGDEVVVLITPLGQSGGETPVLSKLRSPRALFLCALMPLLAFAGSSRAQWLGPKPPARVTRVVTLAPSLTETVLALGAGERLVGVTRFDERPEVAGLPRVGGFTDVSIEAVTALQPNLVVVQMSPGNQKPVETLASLGIPVLALPLTTVEDTVGAMEELGRVLGRVDAATVLAAEFRAVREQVRAKYRARGPGPTVLLAYGFSPFVVAGPGSFADELLRDCSVRNLAQKATTAYPVYSLERAVALAPDVLIDGADTATGKETVQALPQLRRAHWVRLPTLDLLHPGPGLARGLETLCALAWESADGGVRK